MTLFGRVYPLERDKRESCFSKALVRKLSALNKTFGPRSDYQAAVEALVRGNAKLFEWAQDARPKVSENARLMWLIGQLYLHLDAGDTAFLSEARLSALPRAYRRLVSSCVTGTRTLARINSRECS